MSNLYEDPILRKIRDLLDESGPEELRGRWTIGDSLNIPKNILPHGFIALDSSNHSRDANAEVRTTFEVLITVAVDMQNEFNTPTDRSESHERVVSLMEGRNEDYTVSENSVLGCLLKHRDLDPEQNLLIDVGDEGDFDADYGIGAEKRGAGIVTAEGLMRVRVTLDQIAPEFYT